MTEQEYFNLQDKLQAQLERREEVCQDCDYCSTLEKQKYCVFNNGDRVIRPLDDVLQEEEGYCDKWEEEGDNAIYPQCEEEYDLMCVRAYEREKKRALGENPPTLFGWYIEDVGEYIGRVNQFCEKVISVTDPGTVNTSNLVALREGAEMLLAMGGK